MVNIPWLTTYLLLAAMELEILPGLLLPEIHDSLLPPVAPDATNATCLGNPLPPAALMPCLREENAVVFADSTLTPMTTRGGTCAPARDATALCYPCTPETGE